MHDELVKRLRMRARLFKQINQMENSIMDEAADAIEELSKRVDESIPKDDAEIIIAEVAKPHWIPVTERLPEIREVVLITDGVDVGTGWVNQGWWNTSFADIQRDAVTHWMPLPQPPKE